MKLTQNFKHKFNFKDLKINRRLIIQLITLSSIALSITGLLIFNNNLNNQSKSTENQIVKKSNQYHQQIKRLSDTWYAQSAQQTLTDFFNIYHTFSSSSEYELRSNSAKKYATANVIKDKNLFVSDYVNKIHYVDSTQLQSKTMNVIFYPEQDNNNQLTGKVYVTVNAKHGDNQAGTQVVVYQITYDKKLNKLSDIQTVGTEDIQLASNLLNKNN